MKIYGKVGRVQQADLIIVPNLAAKNKLLSWGIAEQKIEVVGMPIHPDFLKPPLGTENNFSVI